MKRCWCIAILLLLLGVAGVVSTYSRLSQTADEPWHVYCGMKWWHGKDVGTRSGVAGNPPLAELMAAAPLFWANKIALPQSLSPRDAYVRETVLTRLGVLPFYILSCVVVLLWSRRLFGMDSALWSLALYISLSTVTGHAGLATTDMGYTAMFLTALFFGVRWLDSPGELNAIIFGESLGLMAATKFSGLLQWPAAMAAILAAQAIASHKSPLHRAHIVTGLIYVLPLSALMLGLLYRFQFGALFADIHAAQELNAHGFAIWLFGPLRHAVWYFFPVVFFFKTPLPFHAAGLFSNWKIIKEGKAERLFPPLAALAVLLASMISNINLGVRHVLVLYPLLAIPAGYGLHLLWQGKLWKRALACGLLLWQLCGFINAWPDHIAYFNVLAGAHPEHISLDSDFDWGQDEAQLAEALQKRNIDAIYLCLRTMHVTDKSRVLLPADVLACPDAPVTGWIAVARAERMGHPHKFAWLDKYQAVQMAGKTLDLYYIPADRGKR